MITPILVGFGTGLSLIAAIGAQNAFVLQQGIRRQFVLPVVLICGLTDALLEFAGVAGIGFVIERAPLVIEIVRWGGVVFLLWYAWGAVRRAIRPIGMVATEGSQVSLKKTVLACLAITWLNPHVYLDTVLLLGSIAATYGEDRWFFAAGAVVASILWFTALGFGARFLGRWLRTPRAWRVLDALIAVIMIAIAISLVLPVLAA